MHKINKELPMCAFRHTHADWQDGPSVCIVFESFGKNKTFELPTRVINGWETPEKEEKNEAWQKSQAIAGDVLSCFPEASHVALFYGECNSPEWRFYKI